MKFYDCKNQEIDKKSFLNLYSNLYFYKNTRFADEPISNALVNGITDIDDIKTILSWKMGGLFKLQPDNDNIAKLRSHTVNLNDLFAFVNSYTGKDLIINSTNIKGLGPVYATALLFFKSKMKYPIFDKYAYVALNAIINENDLSVEQTYRYQSNLEKFWNEYKTYQANLKRVFGGKYKTDRTIDQALWAYGHLFKINEE